MTSRRRRRRAHVDLTLLVALGLLDVGLLPVRLLIDALLSARRRQRVEALLQRHALAPASGSHETAP